ncbi:hypothetical protein ABK040_014596 [Willaertia magna]
MNYYNIENNNGTFNNHTNNVTAENITAFLFLTSFTATVEIVVETSFGFLLFYFSILDSKKVQTLSKLSFYIFVPCLFVNSMARATNIDLLKTCWILIPVGIFIVLFGNILSRIFFFKGFWKSRLSEIQRSSLMLSTNFWNFQTIPLVFLIGIGKTVGDGQLWNISVEKATDSLIAYINIMTLIPIVLFWSYGLHLFKSIEPPKVEEEKELEESNNHVEEANHHSNEDEDHHQELLSIEVQSDNKDNISGKEEVLSLEEDHHSHDEKIIISDTNVLSQPSSQRSIFKRIRESSYFSKTMFTLKHTFNPPVISMLIGITIGFITPLKEFLIVNPPMVVSSIPHVLQLMSSAVFPVGMIILGANIGMTLFDERNKSKDVNKGEEELNKKRNWKEIFTVANIINFLKTKLIRYNHPLSLILSVLIKLVIMPVGSVGVIYLVYTLGLTDKKDPMLILVMLMHFAVPMPMASTTLASLNNDFGQNEICELLLYQYLLSPITLSLFAWWFLNLSCSLTVGVCNS